MNSEIILTIDDGIAYLKVNRPRELNALTRKIVDEMDNAIELIENNDDVRVLVIGSDKNFAAGADINSMVECNPEEARKFTFFETYNKISELKIPTIAVIEGYALGGGMELALTCDFRIASQDAKMGFPETTLGIIPGAGGTIRLPRIVGESKAKELILFGKIINAEEADKIGLVNLVVEKEKLWETASQWATKLKRNGKIALRMAKKSIENSAAYTDWRVGVDIEADIWADLFNTYDQKEGMRAFLEKRKPEYKGI